MASTDNSGYPPIFIGGMFKSGTSLLRAMIGNHSMVASGLETYWFDIEWGNLNSAESKERLRMISEFYELSQDKLASLVEDSSCSEAFLTNLMAYWSSVTGKPRWAEKTPGNVIHIDRIKTYWPDARIVHVVRDPRDIFASMREAGKWDDIKSFMDRWSAVFNKIESFDKQEILNKENYCEIRYEDLVSDPKSTMKAICEFTELTFEPEIAIFKGKKDDFDKVKSVTGKESTTLARLAKPISTDRLGIWKTVLSETDLSDLTNASAKLGLSKMYERVCL